MGFGGYGGLIDRNGVIWSANPMLRWDTAKPLTGPNGVNWRGFSHPSYGLCIDSLGNVYNTSFGNGTIRKFAPNGTLLASFNQGSPWAQGCVVDRNDDVWVAHSLNTNTVGHMKRQRRLRRHDHGRQWSNRRGCGRRWQESGRRTTTAELSRASIPRLVQSAATV